MKKFMEKYDILISAAMIGLLAVIFAWFGSAYVIKPIIDSGREFYIPVRMLGGEVLYKDIFNIYGALSYQINALALVNDFRSAEFWTNRLNRRFYNR